MTDVDLSWLAGFMEGDGSFTIIDTSSGYQCRIALQQSTKDTTLIEKTSEILESYNIFYRRYVFSNREYPQEAIYINRKKEVMKTLKLLAPFMRGRKGAQIEIMIMHINGVLTGEEARKRIRVYKTRYHDDKRGGRKAYKVPIESYAEIKTLREFGGMTLEQIAERYDVTPQAIHYLLKNKIKK